MSFRTSAENRMGNLSRFKTTAPVRDVHSDDDRYDDDDSEEEERLLSRQHGEAHEDAKETQEKKRKSTNEEIAAEYNAAKKQKVSRRRHTISEMDLVQPHGLSAIFTTFPDLFHRQTYKKNRKDMAKFSRQLINAYQQWANKIVPGTPLEEVMWKLQTLNSKTTVKRFLQTMRDQVRNQHVERIYGLEKAEQMIAQLDTGLAEEEGATPQQYEDRPQNDAIDEEEGVISEQVTITTNTEQDVTSFPATAVILPVNPVTPTSALHKTNRHALDDSSDEEELTLVGKTSKVSTAQARRPVVQESDDELEFDVEISEPNDRMSSNGKLVKSNFEAHDPGAPMADREYPLSCPNSPKYIGDEDALCEKTTKVLKPVDDIEKEVTPNEDDSSDEDEFEFETQPTGPTTLETP